MASDALGLLGGQQYFAFTVTDTHKDTDTHTQIHRDTQTQTLSTALECPFPQYFALRVTPPNQDWDIIIERVSQWELRLIV